LPLALGSEDEKKQNRKCGLGGWGDAGNGGGGEKKFQGNIKKDTLYFTEGQSQQDKART